MEPGEASTDIPEAASRRFAEGAFTSGLTVPDFAACLQMGLDPVGYVQGFCVMQWRWYGMGSPFGTFGMPYTGDPGAYSETWQCPHGFVSAEHRGWGQNFEQTWLESAWSNGFGTAYSRMLEEAAAVGAHGVVGVVDTAEHLSDMGVVEFRLRGTAVRLAATRPPDGPLWTTYLAGQRLAKIFEAGYVPVAVAAAAASVRVFANCVTQYLTEGTNVWGGQMADVEIEQLSDAHTAVRRLAREHVRAQLGGDSLHGASMRTTASELGEGDAELQCVLRGNRVRRVKPFAALPSPRPTVRLQ
jgi:uncharacterized protein YbjQ (UPF0145 family)